MNGDQGTLDRYAVALRDSGAAAALAWSHKWRERAERAIAYFIANGREFWADDIRRVAGPPPSANGMGAVILNASKAGRIELVAYRRSARRDRHAARVGVWQGARGGR